MSIVYAVYKGNVRISKEYPTRTQALVTACENDLVLRGQEGNYFLEGVEIRELGEPSLKELGYIPGQCIVRCYRCDAVRADLDKQARSCRNCAQEALDRWRDMRYAH